MRRSLQVIATQPLRKPVSVAGSRSIALAVSEVVATRRGPTVPVTSRVRDSLVLRVVVKKSPARSVHHERRAR